MQLAGPSTVERRTGAEHLTGFPSAKRRINSVLPTRRRQHRRLLRAVVTLGGLELRVTSDEVFGGDDHADDGA